MKIIRKKINFTDARGTITDIFVNSPKDHATVITSKKGAVRGNHYHKKTVQYDFVLSGRLTVFTKKINGKKIYRNELKAYDLAIHQPEEIHTLVADEDSVFLAFADGVRGGEKYENDTFRVSEPLEKLFLKEN